MDGYICDIPGVKGNNPNKKEYSLSSCCLTNDECKLKYTFILTLCNCKTNS